MFDILYRAKEVIGKENELLMNGNQDIQKELRTADDQTPFSRLWILSVQEAKQEGGAVTVVKLGRDSSSLLEFDHKSYKSLVSD